MCSGYSITDLFWTEYIPCKDIEEFMMSRRGQDACEARLGLCLVLMAATSRWALISLSILRWPLGLQFVAYIRVTVLEIWTKCRFQNFPALLDGFPCSVEGVMGGDRRFLSWGTSSARAYEVRIWSRSRLYTVKVVLSYGFYIVYCRSSQCFLWHSCTMFGIHMDSYQRWVDSVTRFDVRDAGHGAHSVRWAWFVGMCEQVDLRGEKPVQ